MEQKKGRKQRFIDKKKHVPTKGYNEDTEFITLKKSIQHRKYTILSVAKDNQPLIAGQSQQLT
ncbi:hypothetical protein BLOT_014565 [Blomia tropicalis]|nr:hypothetical protein BLOT_014565 [Blomia tropicalis]